MDNNSWSTRLQANLPAQKVNSLMSQLTENELILPTGVVNSATGQLVNSEANLLSAKSTHQISNCGRVWCVKYAFSFF